MVSLNDALMELVTKKLVAPDEAYSKSVDKAGFEGLLKRVGLTPTSTGAPEPPARPQRPERPTMPHG